MSSDESEELAALLGIGSRIESSRLELLDQAACETIARLWPARHRGWERAQLRVLARALRHWRKARRALEQARAG